MIIKNSESDLRRVSEPATREEALQIIKLLEDELEKSALDGEPGIGLAAPQIGIYKRVAILRSGSLSLNLVNTQIIETAEQFVFANEGCLSFPGQFSNTLRWRRCTIKNFPGMPEEEVLGLSDLDSVIVQHETGHWDGQVFADFKWIPQLKPGRNDLCSCGSGKKFKKCCL